jgi:hypothetical protein
VHGTSPLPSRASVRYQLPAHAAQGDGRWYLIRLHFAIAFAHQGGNGLVSVSGLTDGHAASQVEFRRRPAGNKTRTRWSSFDLIHGTTRNVSSAHKVEISSTNYLQYGGVHPGDNRFTVELEQLGSPEVKRLRVFRDSGVVVSRRGPAALTITAARPTEIAAVGETIAVHFAIHNHGGREARDVSVYAGVPHNGLKLIGNRTREFARVRGHSHGSFRVKTLRPGHYKMLLTAAGGAHPAATSIDVVVGSIADDADSTALRIGVGTSIVLVGIAVLGVAHVRRRFS